MQFLDRFFYLVGWCLLLGFVVYVITNHGIK